VKSPAVREQSAAQASPSPGELKLTLKVLKERAMSSGYCGRKPEEYGQVWDAKMLHLFGGPLQNTDFAKPSVLGKIASDSEVHLAAGQPAASCEEWPWRRSPGPERSER
jgi:hypothetical protein